MKLIGEFLSGLFLSEALLSTFEKDQINRML